VANRYWVGGGGNVNDTNHWSTSSGGGGGASVPGAADTAIFDSASGSGTCTINVAFSPQGIDQQAGNNIAITQAASVNVGNANWNVNGGSFDSAWWNWSVTGNLNIGAGGTFTNTGMSIGTITGDLIVNASATVSWGIGTVIMGGSGAQTLTCDKDTAAFYDLDITNTLAVVSLGSDIRTTHQLDVNVNAQLDCVSFYDIYVRGTGTPLVLSGRIWGNGRRINYEINASGTYNINGSTGWGAQGCLAGAQMYIVVIATCTATINLTAQIQDINSFICECTTDGSGATITFNTQNNNISDGSGGRGVFSYIRIGSDTAADDCTATFSWGSSEIVPESWSFMRLQWSGAHHNLGSMTFQGNGGSGGTLSVYGPDTAGVDVAQTFTPGTSHVKVNNLGESWMGLGSNPATIEVYDLEMNNPGAIAHCYITPIVHNRLTTTDDGVTFESDVEFQAPFDIEEMYLTAVLTNITVYLYEVGLSIWRKAPVRTGTNFINIRSRVNGTQARVRCDESAQVKQNFNVRDSDLTYDGNWIDVRHVSNVDSGNNSPYWWFTGPEPEPPADGVQSRRLMKAGNI